MTRMIDSQRLLSMKDMEAYLGVSRETVKRMVQRGELPQPLRLGRLVRWDRQKIDLLLDRLQGENDDYADPDEVLANLG